ncbi:hypothetical protein D5F01_LYC12289 [Larimichthys crocea]|uniref:Uncharacterized protein n=1 Tax=Larimichthys crocea TaxID=215358 RepID=A0A6G0IA63_LARCR|nr:uncharacterized protein LOC104926262 [Larimichthys crocea]KAE8288418.1 hypothetical protein D5F01_LYC12289 [Larimichthys crocea]
MDTSDPLALHLLNNSSVIKGKEKTPVFSPVMSCKASNMQRIMQVVHRVAQKSCRMVCQMLCCPLDNLLCDKVACCPAQNHQAKEDKTTQVTAWNPPSTILIVNISNSTLIDCVIGNDNYPSVVAQSQPLMQESDFHMHDQATCSCSYGQQGAALASLPPLPSAEPPSINIDSSHLNCVIIGDNNYMHAEQIHSNETDEPQV